MANYAHAKEIIAANVYTNHDGQVTAEKAKTAINEVVDTLIAGGYLYAGVAKLTPTQTNPGSPDANVFYIATEPGTYTNFVGAGGSLVVADGEVAIFKFNGTWSKETTGAATAAQVNQLGKEVAGGQFPMIGRYTNTGAYNGNTNYRYNIMCCREGQSVMAFVNSKNTATAPIVFLNNALEYVGSGAIAGEGDTQKTYKGTAPAGTAYVAITTYNDSTADSWYIVANLDSLNDLLLDYGNLKAVAQKYGVTSFSNVGRYLADGTISTSASYRYSISDCQEGVSVIASVNPGGATVAAIVFLDANNSVIGTGTIVGIDNVMRVYVGIAPVGTKKVAVTTQLSAVPDSFYIIGTSLDIFAKIKAVEAETDALQDSLYRDVNQGSFIQTQLKFTPDNLVFVATDSTFYAYYLYLPAGAYRITGTSNPARELYVGFSAEVPALNGAVTLLGNFYGTSVNEAITMPQDGYLVVCRRYNRFTDCAVTKPVWENDLQNAEIAKNAADIQDLRDIIGAKFNIVNAVAQAFIDNVGYDSGDYSYSLMPESRAIVTTYDKSYPRALVASWADTIKNKTVKLADNDGFVGGLTYQLTNGESQFVVENMCPGKVYYLKVSDSDAAVLISRKIEPFGNRRMLHIDGTQNVRDLGGLQTLNGKSILFDKIIRGGALNTTTAKGKSQLLDLVGVGAEIDIRPTPSSSSPLGSGVVFDAFPIPEAYDAIVSTTMTGYAPARQILKALIRNLNNGLLTYVHCQGGADRTGSICLLLAALCGVSESECVKDYEMTSYSPYGVRYRTLDQFKTMISNIKLRNGNTFQEKVRNWWLENDGTYIVTSEELDEFVGLMVP